MTQIIACSVLFALGGLNLDAMPDDPKKCHPAQFWVGTALPWAISLIGFARLALNV